MMKLNNLQINTPSKILKIDDIRLMEMGLIEGEDIEIIRKGSIFILKVGDMRLAIDSKLTENIFVQGE